MNHFYEIALTLIKGIGKIRIRNLISIYGTAEQVFSRKSINTRISGLGDIIISENDRDEALRRAEAERPISSSTKSIHTASESAKTPRRYFIAEARQISIRKNS